MNSGWATFIGITALVPSAIYAHMETQSRARATESGRALAAAWLSRRSNLSDIDFDDRGPAAAAVWGPFLAHAVAMDLAPTAARAVPFGTDDDGLHGWSQAGGQWRRVRITYPMWRPFWGYRPARVAIAGVVAMVASATLAVLLAGVTNVPTAHPAAVAFALLGLGWLVVAAGAVFDVFRPIEVQGEVIRLRYRPSVAHAWWPIVHRPRWFVVVDDGDAWHLPAWSVSSGMFGELAEGEIIAVHVTRFTGRVEAVHSISGHRAAPTPKPTIPPRPAQRKHRGGSTPRSMSARR